MSILFTTNTLRYKLVILLIAQLFFGSYSNAQYQGTYHTGEFGIQAGAAHYFGDLNTISALNRPGVAFGAFFRKQLNNYTALRFAVNHAKLSYSDNLQSKNEFQRRRNLDFSSRIWEVLILGDFNFFRFNPSNPDERFTPFLTFGLGLFSFNPYTFLEGEKQFLRPLGTEGQNSSAFPDKKAYPTSAICLPIGFGVKWSLNSRVNMHFEITHRFTTTDYLDDVSGSYAGKEAFLSGTAAALLQDRSYETGELIGKAGFQRGFNGNKDQYIVANLGITFNFSSYRCPGAN